MKKYPLINAAKLYCAVLVVLIHALEIPDGHYWGHLFKSTLSSQAVPFFFIASGFFFKKNRDIVQDKKQFTLNYVKHLLTFYLVWVFISAPEILHQYLTKYPDGSFFYLSALIFRRVLCAGYGVFWYLLVLAESALVLGFILKKERLTYILAVLGICLDLIYQTDISLPGFRTFNQLIYLVFSWNNNFLMKGLPYMAIGVYFANYCGGWTLKVKHLLVAYVSAFLIHVVVFAVVHSAGGNPDRFTILYPIQAILLFLVSVSAECSVIPESIIRECRSVSSAIYCLHCFMIYYVINPIIGINANVFIRVTVAVGLSVGLYWIVKTIKFRPLMRLITLK